MDPVKLADKFAGSTCPQCDIPGCTLWRISATTLTGSECCRLINLDPNDRDYPIARHWLIEVQSEYGHRYFATPKSLAPEDLLRSLLGAYVILEDCSHGWIGADATQAVYELLSHSLEGLGVKEVLEKEIEDATSEWRDPSILGGGDY